MNLPSGFITSVHSIYTKWTIHQVITLHQVLIFIFSRRILGNVDLEILILFWLWLLRWGRLSFTPQPIWHNSSSCSASPTSSSGSSSPFSSCSASPTSSCSSSWMCYCCSCSARCSFSPRCNWCCCSVWRRHVFFVLSYKRWLGHFLYLISTQCCGLLYKVSAPLVNDM